jgi:hypothetical protein
LQALGCSRLLQDVLAPYQAHQLQVVVHHQHALEAVLVQQLIASSRVVASGTVISFLAAS